MAKLSDKIAPVLRETITLTSSGTYNKPTYPWLRQIIVKVLGGGGPSGPMSGFSGACGAGGGGGGYCEKKYLASSFASSYSYTIGAGGIPYSTNGGTSTFDTMTAGGGTHAWGTYSGGAGIGGTASGGDKNVSGGSGGTAGNSGTYTSNSSLGGVGSGGGNYLYPTGLDGRTSSGPGVVPPANTGIGASGPLRTDGSTTIYAGASGSAGIIIIELYS